MPELMTPRSSSVTVGAAQLVRVLDHATGVPVWLAHVYTTDEHGAITAGAVTDADGYASLSPYDGTGITVSAVGWVTRRFLAWQGGIIDVYLERDVVELPEVVITPDGNPVVIPGDVLPPPGGEGGSDVPADVPPAGNGSRRWLGWGLLAAAVAVVASDA